MFSLICARINGWVNNRKVGDLRHHRAHYDVPVMERGNPQSHHRSAYTGVRNLSYSSVWALWSWGSLTMAHPGFERVAQMDWKEKLVIGVGGISITIHFKYDFYYYKLNPPSAQQSFNANLYRHCGHSGHGGEEVGKYWDTCEVPWHMDTHTPHTYYIYIYIYICWFNFDALAQGNAYKPTKEPINYRGPGGDRTHDLQTEATPPAASCPARTLHATEIAPKNATPMTCPWLHWTTDNLSGMHMVSISTPVCVNFELRPGAGDIHICWFNFDALAQIYIYRLYYTCIYIDRLIIYIYIYIYWSSLRA